MSDDLVKRLHKWVDDLEHDCDYELEFELSGEEAGDFAADIRDALTRIEKLEAALREIADGPRDADKSYVSLFHEIQSEARKALEGKDG